MKLLLIPTLLGALCAPWFVASPAQDPTPQDMQAMMQKARRYTEPGEHHELLKRFLGKWDSETRFFMGGQASPAERGNAEFSWLMPGRWLKIEASGTMMRRPMQSFHVFGYDNFKQSYVMSSVQSLDTAMNHAEGDLDPGGKALLMYGTLDEYLTGEHDKMVKYVWRFEADDEMRLEVHDLPIGEQNTKVVEISYKRTN